MHGSRCIVQGSDGVWCVTRNFGMRVHVSEFRVQDSQFGLEIRSPVLGFGVYSMED